MEHYLEDDFGVCTLHYHENVRRIVASLHQPLAFRCNDRPIVLPGDALRIEDVLPVEGEGLRACEADWSDVDWNAHGAHPAFVLCSSLLIQKPT